VFRNRPSLLWLIGPPVLYLGALPLANRVTPTVAGIPFLLLWLILATLLTPLCIRLAAAHDPVWRAAEDRTHAERPEEAR
jgi:uncharacterized BrkB/YihY/UPF0761 family membrane protein